MSITDGLNASQQAAVFHGSGPCIVTAGAGSGKTRVLIHRIAHLINLRGIPPTNILTMTFTKRAANEMREQLFEIEGGLGPTLEVTVGTIHSIGYRILRAQWDTRNTQYDVLQGGAQQRLMKSVLGPPGVDNPYGLNWDLDLKLALSRISQWKNSLVSPNQVPLNEPDGAQWRALYTRYEAAKNHLSVLDLDDMLVWTYDLLRQNAAIRTWWQRQWPWILVDEAQDNSQAQWAIIRLLAAPNNNLFVVGDYDQSIYSWRGSYPEALRGFRDQYRDAIHINLDTNYRSQPYLVSISNRLINHNPRPYPRDIHAVRTDTASRPLVWTPSDDGEEGQYVAQFVAVLQKEGHTVWGDIGIIYRTHAQSQPIEDSLTAARIPYRILGGIGFWGRREVTDLVAYLRLLTDPTDTGAFGTAVMAPPRFLGRQFVRNVIAYATLYGVDLLSAVRRVDLTPYQRRHANTFLSLLTAIRRLDSPGDRLDVLRDLTDYDTWWMSHNSDDNDDRLGNLDQLCNVAHKFPSTEKFLQHVAEAEIRVTKPSDQANAVTLLTIHRAKGLEWPVVIIPGCTQGVLPHKHALDADDPTALEEERRLAYVAITRARDTLVLSIPTVTRNSMTPPSQFLGEMGIALDDLDDADISPDMSIGR